MLAYDLLDPAVEDRFAREPGSLEAEIRARSRVRSPDWVIIDEVQKAPRLLDVVHRLIERDGLKFPLSGTGSTSIAR